MSSRVPDPCLDTIFRNARTYNGWSDQPLTDDTIREIYDLMKWGPTSMNASPARFLWIRSKEAKERLRPALSPGNVDKTMRAPATVVIAYDLRFYEKLPKLFPANLKAKEYFIGDPTLSEATTKRNSSLQGAYLIIAARALGLDCGPMSGFDNAKLDAEFFGPDTRDELCQEHVAGCTRSNFLCNIGYGDPKSLYPRGPRLSFDEACRIL